MNEYLAAIMLHTEMDHRDALKKIITALPGNSRAGDFMIVLSNYNDALNQKSKNAINEADFSVAKSRITDSIYFFLKKLPEELIKRVHEAFFPGNKPAQSIETTTAKDIHDLLLVSATPIDLDALRTNKEFNEIAKRIKLAPGTPKVRIAERVLAAKFDDLVEHLVSFKPSIVHFSGHGDEHRLFFEQENGELIEVPEETLIELFHEFRAIVQCVVFNACYSSSSAQQLSKMNIYVVGMNDAVLDDASLNFACAFYSALARGENFERSFRLACIQLQVSNWTQSAVPELWLGGNKIERS